jgi:uncharacterized protein DUF3775
LAARLPHPEAVMNQTISTATGPPPGIELGINPDKVCHIIAKARAFDAKEDVSDPDSGSNAVDDGMADVLEDLPDSVDATRLELIEFIRALDEDEQFNLVALAWLGRGTYEISEWREALNVARNEHNKRTAEYLLHLPLLGDYLEEGLAAFGENCGES